MPITIRPIPSTAFLRITGPFYRAIYANAVDNVLHGSTQPGRFSTTAQKTLYLSASEQGVTAAMLAHTTADTPIRTTVRLKVDALNILDLRDAAACDQLGINPKDAALPWQNIVKHNKIPTSQILADQLRDLGAFGLIDPSRKAPGLWHLVLFRWNDTIGPQVFVDP